MIDHDQTIFDAMLVADMIELPEHEAAHLFIEALGRSGSSVQSLDIEKMMDGGRTQRSSADSIADQRMIFSAAYRSMNDSCTETTLKAVMDWCNSPYRYSKDKEDLAGMAQILLPGLRKLARYYGCSVRDPRRILRTQVYGS